MLSSTNVHLVLTMICANHVFRIIVTMNIKPSFTNLQTIYLMDNPTVRAVALYLMMMWMNMCISVRNVKTMAYATDVMIKGCTAITRKA